MVRLYDSIQAALQALAANRLRASLTMLGMVIGVASVISLTAIGEGAKDIITVQIRGIGTNLIVVLPGAQRAGGVRAAVGTATTLTWEDSRAIAESVEGVALVAPELVTTGQVVAGGENVATRVSGVTPDYEEVRNYEVTLGSFLQQSHMDTRAPVAVLGSHVAELLFGTGADPVGETLRINRAVFRVLGVLASKGGQNFGNYDDIVLVPLTTFEARLVRQSRASRGRPVSYINVQLLDEGWTDPATEAIRQLLRQRHHVEDDDFTVLSQRDLLLAADEILSIVTIFLGIVAGISLLVGGIGIMNIMLVSVTERTREIGIRKAVGANRRAILTQFLVEALVLSALGGTLGIALGLVVTRIVDSLQLGGDPPLQTAVSPQMVFLALTVSALIGLFFGLYPAARAARLHPIDALRYE